MTNPYFIQNNIDYYTLHDCKNPKSLLSGTEIFAKLKIEFLFTGAKNLSVVLAELTQGIKFYWKQALTSDYQFYSFAAQPYFTFNNIHPLTTQWNQPKDSLRLHELN